MQTETIAANVKSSFAFAGFTIDDSDTTIHVSATIGAISFRVFESRRARFEE